MRFDRTKKLIGEDNLNKIKSAYVAVFGVGGVGSFACEAIARAGVGKILICDNDIVSDSNINRQLIALSDTVGKKKTTVMRERIEKINENAEVIEKPIFFSAEAISEFDFTGCSYIIDAIDTVTSKLLLIETAKEKNIPIISCMGAGNKLSGEGFKVADIYSTSVCPLCRVMRRELKTRGIDSLKVVYSEEVPQKVMTNGEEGRKIAPGSISFVPPVAGFIAAGEVIRDIMKYGE